MSQQRIDNACKYNELTLIFPLTFNVNVFVTIVMKMVSESTPPPPPPTAASFRDVHDGVIGALNG